MVCAYCGSKKTKVLKTVTYDTFIRRTRECCACGRTFDTDELRLKVK